MSRKPTPLFPDEIDRHVVRMRGFLGMLQGAAAARDCLETRESLAALSPLVEACPYCGGPAVLHKPQEAPR